MDLHALLILALCLASYFHHRQYSHALSRALASESRLRARLDGVSASVIVVPSRTDGKMKETAMNLVRELILTRAGNASSGLQENVVESYQRKVKSAESAAMERSLAVLRCGKELEEVKGERDKARAELAEMRASLGRVKTEARDEVNKVKEEFESKLKKDLSFFASIDRDSKKGTVAPKRMVEEDEDVELQMPPPPPRPPKRGNDDEDDRVANNMRTKAATPFRVVNCEKFAFEFNTKRVGKVISTTQVSSAHRCKKTCSNDADCHAWTFLSDASECKLLGDWDGGKSVPSLCCVAGIRCD